MYKRQETTTVFTSIAVAGPGVMGDNDAMGECELKKLIENLPIG
jgi:hypothetical protein